MGVALVALLVALLLAAAELDQTAIDLPALELAVVAVAVTYDLLGALDQLDRVLVDAAQDQRSAVRGDGEADAEVRLAAAGLAAVESLVGRAVIGIGLRPGIGRPCRLGRLPRDIRVLPRNLAQERLELRARAFDLAQQVVEERQGF